MAAPFRPAAGGSYFRKTEDDAPVLIERTGDENSDGWTGIMMPAETASDETPVAALVELETENEAPKGRRKGR